MATAEARAALPEQVPLGDAVFTVARATLLGAALASGSHEIFADARRSPARAYAPRTPLLAEVREQPPGALGATISGPGPTVVVWAHPHEAKECSVELSNRFPDVEVLCLDLGEGAEVIT